MKTIIIILLFLSTTQCFSQSGWQQVTIPLNTLRGQTFSNIYFINKDLGFLWYRVADNGPTTYGNTYMTTNGGESFSLAANFMVLTSVFFKNNSTGWISGYNYNQKSGLTTRYTFFTTNNGINWDTTEILNSGRFINENNGWKVKQNGSMYRTTNGGSTWTGIPSTPCDYLTVNTLDSINSVYLLTAIKYNSNIGSPAGYYYSTNSGTSWNTVLVNFYINPLTHINFYNGTGFAPTRTNGLSYDTFKSTNYGINWSVVSSNNLVFRDMCSLNSQNFWGLDSSGSIKYSSNGGNTFVNQFTGGISDYGDAIFMFPSDSLNHSVGYAKLNNKLYKTTSGGFSVHSYIGNENNIIEKFILLQNYPNPFNPVTNIRYSIPEGTGRDMTVQLKVYDVNGKEIETLVNENQIAGSYSVNFNAANYPSGVYFYKLETNNFSETKKMILLK